MQLDAYISFFVCLPCVYVSSSLAESNKSEIKTKLVSGQKYFNVQHHTRSDKPNQHHSHCIFVYILETNSEHIRLMANRMSCLVHFDT